MMFWGWHRFGCADTSAIRFHSDVKIHLQLQHAAWFTAGGTSTPHISSGMWPYYIDTYPCVDVYSGLEYFLLIYGS